MDGASFAKLCRETGLLGGKLNSTSVDLAFTKAKAKVSPTCPLHLLCLNSICLTERYTL